MLLSVVSELPRQTGSGANPPVVSEQPRRRAEGTLLNYIAGDGDRLPDLVATISELRHCPTFAAPGAVVVLECPSRVVCHERRHEYRRCATVREMKEGPSGSAIR